MKKIVVGEDLRPLATPIKCVCSLGGFKDELRKEHTEDVIVLESTCIIVMGRGTLGV
jgi:hypothetical protein